MPSKVQNNFHQIRNTSSHRLNSARKFYSNHFCS